MNRNGKLKRPKTFYLCDQLKDCRYSERCGKECKHTHDISHAKHQTSYAACEFEKKPNGDMWEVEELPATSIE